MSRSLARRVTVLTALGSCLTASALPALAHHDAAPNTEEVTVSVDAVEGTRQFRVMDAQGLHDLTRLDFGDQRELPFRVVVSDRERSLNGGFQVTATMTNLYLKNAAEAATPYDLDTFIASEHVSLGYAANPLEATGLDTLVRPRIQLDGALDDCTDPATRTLLGIQIPTDPRSGLLVPVETFLANLTGVADRVCDALDGAAQPFAQVVDGPLRPVELLVNQALSVVELPVGLSGAQEGGPFTSPAYGGGIAPERSDAPAPTTRQIMSGTPGVTPGLSQAVNTIIGDAVGGDVLSLLDLDQLLEGLRANPALAAVITALDDPELTPEQRRGLLGPLEARLVDLLPVSVPLVSGDYVARPSLRVNPVTTTPGTYEGTLTVDFFDGLPVAP
jgi:hypothetical protein